MESGPSPGSSPGALRSSADLAISGDGEFHGREISQIAEAVLDEHALRINKPHGEERAKEEQEGQKEGDPANGNDEDEKDDLFFLKRTKSLTGSIKIANSSKSLTLDVEQLVADMSHPVTGVTVKDRKWRLKTYKKCFVGTEAVDWLVNRLEMSDREDAVSVGQELMRLQFFCHVCDDKQEFRDDYLFYHFMGAPRPDKGGTTFIIRSMEELFVAISDPKTGVPVTDRKYHFKIYKTCFVASELVDWMMSHLPLRSRDEAEKIGVKLANEGFIKHVVDEDKVFQDTYLFYRFTKVAKKEAAARRARVAGPAKAVTIFDFDLLKVLGVGAFGKVMMVRKKDTGQVFAMKALDKKEVAVSERSIRNLKSERNILRNDHPFLVHLHFSFQTEDKLYLVMDYISGGDMFFHLRRKGKFSEKEAQHFAAEITLALEHLHSYGIIYRDLKPENVLFDKDGHVCLTDFGISKEVGELKTKTLCGTPSYLAPEILKGEAYAESVDWWSLGVLVLEMVTGRNPFRSKNIHQTMQWIMKKEVVYPDYLDAKTVDFIMKLLSRDPSVRLGCGATGAREVKAHPFLKGTNWTDLAVKKVKSPFKINVKSDTDTSYFSSEFTKMSLADELREFTATAHPEGAVSPPSASTDSFADWAHTTPTASLI